MMSGTECLTYVLQHAPKACTRLSFNLHFEICNCQFAVNQRAAVRHGVPDLLGDYLAGFGDARAAVFDQHESHGQ
jgi:hypothetical protein